MAMRPNMEPDRTDRPSARPRMTRRAGGVQDSGQGGRMPQRPMSPPMPGGRIPSPRQSYEGLERRPSSAGGQRDALIRAYMARSETPEMGSTVPGEGMNKPAMDINDAFFGPDRKPFQWTDIIDFLMNRPPGGER
jgi:hypothetical protein